jgi:hypothetical protein
VEDHDCGDDVAAEQFLLTWTDLPNSVRLSIGGFAVAAKGVARMPDLVVDPAQRERLGIGLLVALIAAASTVVVFERAGSEHWSIVVGAVVLGLGLTPLLVVGRRRGHLAVLVVIEIGISVVLTLISTSAFFILIRPAIYTAIAGVYVLATVPSADPFALRISRTVTVAGDSLRANAFDGHGAHHRGSGGRSAGCRQAWASRCSPNRFSAS